MEGRHTADTKGETAARTRGRAAHGARRSRVGGVEAVTAEQATERVLVIYTAATPPERLAETLRQQRLECVTERLSRDAFWPAGDFIAAVVCALELSDDVRAVAPLLKSTRQNLPLVLWAGNPPSQLVDVFSAGFDAWVPAEAGESSVAAQIRVLCRLVRTAVRPPEPDAISVRNVTIEMQRHEVTVNGQTVMLTPTEFRILSHLATRPGRTVGHTDLFRDVHGYDAAEQEAKDILKVHIWRLRNKLSAAGADQDLIVNVRGFGYLLERRGARGEAGEASEGEQVAAPVEG